MGDSDTIETFTQLLGQTIVDIKYIETRFHYDLSGDWTTVNPDSFVLHSPEWELNLSNGQKWFLTNPQGNLTDETAKSNITLSTSTIANTNDKKFTVPDLFGWTNILNKQITGIRFYKRLLNRNTLLGIELGKTYQDNIQIIQFLCSGNTFSITTMNGDIGDMTFYPTGYLGERLGVFINKTIAASYTDSGLTMTMEMMKEVKWKE
jgi:hypothetical protein